MGVWMWHDGDYEVYHFLSLHLRREERGYIRPPFWKLAAPYPTVKFKRHITCSGGYLCCQINGQGYVEVDKMRFCAGERIEIAPGTHRIRIQVANTGGLPAAILPEIIVRWDIYQNSIGLIKILRYSPFLMKGSCLSLKQKLSMVCFTTLAQSYLAFLICVERILLSSFLYIMGKVKLRAWIRIIVI